MRRSWIAAVALAFGLPGVARGQVVLPAGTQVILPTQLPSIGLPLPPIGLPLPEIAQPLPGTIPPPHVAPRMQPRRDGVAAPVGRPGVRPGNQRGHRGTIPYGGYYPPFIYVAPQVVFV